MGMPRSGTSWLSQIFDSSPAVRFRLSPLFSYAFKNAVNETSTHEEWECIFQDAYASDNAFMNQTKRRAQGEYPHFEQKEENPEHLVLKFTRFHNLAERMLTLFDELKMIAIIRHPCGAIHSWLTAPHEFPTDKDPIQEWRSGACRKTGFGEFWGFEDWKTVTRMHLRLKAQYPDRFYLLRYEDLVNHPHEEVIKVFDFVGLASTPQTDEFLKASRTSHVDSEYAVFKKPTVKDRWRTELDPSIRKAILADIHATALERFIR